MKFRSGLLALCAVVAAGCGREQGVVSRHAEAALAPAGESGVAAGAFAMASPTAAAAVHRFARLPDRGELVAYHPDAVRKQGAYTWYRADISEAHALDAIGGTLRIVAPNGTPLAFRYDRHVEHPSGDWTWIGHIAGRPELQAILTFGANAAFGEIAQPDDRPLRLTVQNGASWLMATDARVLAGQINAYTRPQASDALVVPRAMLRRGRSGSAQALAPSQLAVGTGTGTVDLVLGYTPGMVTMLGSTSAVLTRLNYLVDLTNQAYANSAINAQVRLVKTVAVNYTETNNNDTALEQLSGYHASTGSGDSSKWITPDPAFNALRAARETYGADLVSLVRRFQDPEQTSCGVAWLLGGGKQGITAGDGWDQLGYSVVSDTNGNGAGSFPDNGYICEDHTLAHELGHNMGSAHDRVTAEGDDGVLNDPDDYGAYTYSFGYKPKTMTANFYTIMAYGDRGQTSYLVFSNPRITFCGGQACGTTTYEDNARSLSQTIPVVATFRQTKVATGSLRNDLNHDGRSDLLWRYRPTGTVQLWMMNSRTMTSHVNLAQPPSFAHLANGDFNADGFVDIAWRDSSNQVVIWLNNGSGGFTHYTISGLNSDWVLRDAIDINGDKKCDLVWQYVPTGTVQYWLMNGGARASYRNIAQSASYQFLAAGDFDADGFGDLAWRKADNRVAIWKGNGVTFTEASMPGLSRDWQVLDALDVNGDGKSDLLWRYLPSGSLQYWLMDGPRLAGYRNLVQSASYAFLGSGDYNGDGRGDIAWRRVDQRVAIWLGNGATFTEGSLPGLSTDWIPLNAGQ